MTKRKSNVQMNCARDRLSELPDELIFDIFQLLPMTDVVRTTILSKRWKKLWTTFPCLEFNSKKMTIDTDKFRGFVDGALNSWRGINIVKFIVEFRRYIKSGDLDSISDIDKWIRFATERKVQELKLFVPLKFVVPQCLYSCSSLKELWLAKCDFKVDGNVQWYRLKTLKIYGEGLSENSINQVMRGSPQLEVFFLTFRNTNENLSIRSNSLRLLDIMTLDNRDARVIGPELRIWTPNLKTLAIWGIEYSQCFLMNVASLTKVSLHVDGPHISDFAGAWLSGIFPSLKHVYKVTLSNWCIKELGAMKERHMSSPFPIVRFLKLNVCSEEYQHVVGVLEMFPELRELVLQTTYQTSVPKHAESSLGFNTNLPNLFLLHLRKVYVTWTVGDDFIFPLLQFLLKYARNLEKMVFSRDKGDADESPALWKSLASQKLLQMERSSTTAKLVFC